ncbi:hypothetical protein HDU89_001609 [Geranomyces variabilis]|nr:hypothetical protein HDU89_001609 [Geranomyces variabilis]
MLSIEFALVPSSSQDTPGPLIRRKNMMPDTVAQIIVKLLAAEIIKKKQYSSFLNLALACRSLKLAAYQRIRPELMQQQAEWVKANFPPTEHRDALSDFCDLFHVAGNPLVDLDPFIIALFPSTKLLKRCRLKEEPHMIRCPYAVVQFNTDDPGFAAEVTYFAATSRNLIGSSDSD